MAKLTFALRLAIFLVAAIYSPIEPASSLSIIILVTFLATLPIDIFLGNTFWLSCRATTYIIQVLFLIPFTICALSIAFANYPRFGDQHMITVIFAILAFNSDAISSSRNWVYLVPTSLVAFFTLLILQFASTPIDMKIPPTAWVYAFVPALSCVARLLFPRTKDLIHSSLDYPPFRLEILSYGLKRPAAIGIKRD